MFRKLVSNLPFNPSLINQVSFYAKRMHQETAVRRLGVGLVALAMFIQVFAVVSPAEPTLARVGNDLIPGGASSQGQLVNHCNANDYDFATILSHFGIDCYALFFGSVRTINANEYGGQLYSMGRAPYGKPGETPVTIPGAGTFYMRPLNSWGNANYTAIVGNRADGTPFMVLFDCGNLVIVGRPPTNPPPKAISCSILHISVGDNKRVDIGTQIAIQGNARGSNLPAGERVDMYYQYVNASSGSVIETQEARGVPFNGGTASDSNRLFTVNSPGHYQFRLIVKYDGSTKDAAGNATGGCVRNVYVNTPPPEPEIEIACTNLISSFGNGQKVIAGDDVTVRGQATGKNLPDGELVDMYYDYVDEAGKIIDSQNAKGIKHDDNGLFEDNVARSFKLDTPGNYTFRLAVKYDGSTKSATGNRTGDCAKQITVQEPCLEDDEQDDTQCLILSKKARNDTQDIENADGTVANAGDTIIYTLSTKNTSKNTVIEDYVVQENLIDVLQYADIVNLSGGKLDEYGIAMWPAIDIQPGETINTKFVIRIKNPIPQTPTSVSDPGSYDMKLTNIYGNTVNIKLPPTIVKTTEYVSKELPNTGPGETLAVGFVVLSVSGYFFMRSRLLAKEADIIRSDYAVSGGM